MNGTPHTNASGDTFRALVGDSAYDIRRADGRVVVSDRAHEVSFEVVGDGHVLLRVDGRSFSAAVERNGDADYRVTLAGRRFGVRVQDERALLLERYGLSDGAAAGARALRAPMPGLVLSVAVAVGDRVVPDQGLVVLEAMKMENELRAEAGGIVRAVHVTAGDAVGKNDLLLEMEAE